MKLRESYHQEPASIRHTQDNVPFLVDGVCRVRLEHRQRIRERRGRFMERNAVLLSIGRRFLGVLFEEITRHRRLRVGGSFCPLANACAAHRLPDIQVSQSYHIAQFVVGHFSLKLRRATSAR